MGKKYNIEICEKEILEDFEKGELVSVANASEEMQIAEEAASNFMKQRNQTSDI